MKRKRISQVIAFIVCVGLSLGIFDVPKGMEKFSMVKEVRAASGGIANNGLGGININIYGSPYTDFRNFSMGEYAYTESGCAWFASARVNQLTGQGTTIRAGTNWWRNAASLGYSRGQELKAPAIACWGNHVAIVEKVEGNTIYLSEGGHLGYPNNGYTRIGTVPGSYFSTNDKGNWLGFVYLPGATSNTDTTAPSITNVTVTDVNRDGYTVTCNVSDNVGVTSVKFPSWCSDIHSGEDAIWIEGGVSGNTASARINVSSLKSGGCQGNYVTHIYAYDAAGNRTSYGLLPPVFIDQTGPVISNVSVQEVDNTGYTVSCTVTDNNEVDRVQFPTWTDANGQDDLAKEWGSNPAVQGTRDGNVYTFRVTDSAHNYERGEYITHIYAYDKHNNRSMVEVPGVELNNTYQAVNTVTWNNHTYVCYDDLMTWKEALNFSKALSGYLVTITSQEENDIVQTLIRGGKRDAYFIGLTDDKQEGHPFRWENGETVIYTNWEEGEPNDHFGLEDCAEIKRLQGKWHDVLNNWSGVGFVIEIPSSVLEQPSENTNTGQTSGTSPQTPVSEQQLPNAAVSDTNAQEVNEASYLYSKNKMSDESAPVSSKMKKVIVYIGSRKNRTVTLACKKISGMTGYQIQYSSNKKMKKAKSKITHKASTMIKRLEKKKTIYFRVRAFKVKAGKRIYGSWSKVKKG